MPKYTDEDIRNMSKITCKIAADYLGISPMAVSIGMRNDLLPIGFAIHNEERDRTYSESWSYHIIGERLIAYKYTQNEKIEQVTDSTMVVGVDIGSQIHYARAFDNRGRELTKRIFSFHNDLEGFNSFNLWAETLKTENKKTAVLIGCEPTGHYWFAFAKYVNDHQKRLVMVNPFSVKKIKELDDNSPKKTDSKDPKTIAKLVVDGRYSIPYMPEGIYAEIRDLVYSREPIWII